MKKLTYALFLTLTTLAQAEVVLPESLMSQTVGHSYGVSYENVTTAADLFDGATNSNWTASTPKVSTGNIPTVKMSLFDGSLVVNAYAISAVQVKNLHHPASAPKKWTLFGAKSATSEWVALDSREGYTEWTSGLAAGVVDTRTFTFANTEAYSCYKIEFYENNGNTKYLYISEFALLHGRDDSKFEVVSSLPRDILSPTPSYGGLTGCKAGDVIDIDTPSDVWVDPETSARYELAGWDIKNYDGTVLASGEGRQGLPTTFTHQGTMARLTWHWIDQRESVRTARLTDLTVLSKSGVNEIKADDLSGSDNPSRAFDDKTTTKWSVLAGSADTDHWVQYKFETATPIVTGVGANLMSLVNAYRLDFSATGEDGSWITLLDTTPKGRTFGDSGTTARRDFDNMIPAAYYRLHVRGNPSKSTDKVGVFELELYSYRTADTLEVYGEPKAYGTPEPNYGITSGLASGDSVHCTAPSGTIDVSDGVRTACTGYRLEVAGAAPVTVSDTAFDFTNDGRYAKLTWLWNPTYRQCFSAPGGSVSVTETWAAAGAMVSVTATSSGAGDFAYWAGDVPEGHERENPLVYQADQPRTIRAVFAAPIYVKPASEGGDDANDGLSWSTAKATPGAALACDSSAVYMAPGVYEVAGDSLTVAKGIVFAGGANPSQTVLRVLPETLGTGAVLRVTHALARVSGLTLEGGTSTDGFAAGLVMTGGAVSNCVIRNCQALASGSKGGGAYLASVSEAVALTVTTNSTKGSGGGLYLAGVESFRDSRLEGNTATSHGGGAYAELSDAVLCVTNCQFVGNTSKGAGGGMIDLNAMTMQTCLFKKNTASGQIADKTGGGGLQLYTQKACVVEDSVFEENKASGSAYGGGIDCSSSCLTMRRCILASNSANRGGGFNGYTAGANTLLAQLTVTNNVSESEGGGLFLVDTELRDSLVADNYSKSTSTKDNGSGGGGIEAHSGTVILRNVTVTRNRAGAKAGGVRGSCTVYNSIIWDNEVIGASVNTNIVGGTLNYSCVGDPWRTGTGSISADPKFIGAERGDYTLKASSPCVNAGSNAYVKDGEVDLAGNPRIYVSGGKPRYDIVDMGCYESTHSRQKGMMIIVH